MYRILNDYTVRHYMPKGEKTILIRLLEPVYRTEGVPYCIEFESEFKAILNVYVDDVVEDNELAHKYFHVFSEEMAAEIVDFVDAHEFDELIVHCNKGMSRSSAVMIGILNHLEEFELEQMVSNSNLYTPNELIVSVFKQYNQKMK